MCGGGVLCWCRLLHSGITHIYFFQFCTPKTHSSYSDVKTWFFHILLLNFIWSCYIFLIRLNLCDELICCCCCCCYRQLLIFKTIKNVVHAIFIYLHCIARAYFPLLLSFMISIYKQVRVQLCSKIRPGSFSFLVFLFSLIFSETRRR